MDLKRLTRQNWMTPFGAVVQPPAHVGAGKRAELVGAAVAARRDGRGQLDPAVRGVDAQGAALQPDLAVEKDGEGGVGSKVDLEGGLREAGWRLMERVGGRERQDNRKKVGRDDQCRELP